MSLRQYCFQLGILLCKSNIGIRSGNYKNIEVNDYLSLIYLCDNIIYKKLQKII